ncbi:MAG: REP-associated tyrosine transposase [Armatimonadota bacterium]
MPERKNHRLPLDSYSSTDCKYFFTICTHGRSNLFADSHLCSIIINSLLWYHEHNIWNLYCYCLMPDHLHILISLLPESKQSDTNTEDILKIIARFKSYTDQQWRKRGKAQPLWQKSIFDSIIDQFEPADEVISYILNNPVRKGLVENWENYPYCGVITAP